MRIRRAVLRAPAITWGGTSRAWPETARGGPGGRRGRALPLVFLATPRTAGRSPRSDMEEV